MLDERTIPRVFGYRLGDFRLELGKRRLVGCDGQVISLSGRAWDVLAHLVEERGRVVGKDELIKAVWPHTVVEDNNLNQAISIIRRAFGDTRDDPRYIATVAGRGYQFVGNVVPLAEAPAVAHDPGEAVRDSVEASAPMVAGTAERPELVAQASPLEASSGPSALGAPTLADVPASRATNARSLGALAGSPAPNRSRRVLLAGLATATIAAAGAGSWLTLRPRRTVGAPKSIAVLPFRPLLPEGGNAAMELGVTEQLINRLSRVPGVVVTPLSSVVSAAHRDADPIAAGRKLGVAAVVDGHLQMYDERVRLTARLIDTESGASLWANTYTEPLGDLLAVQDSLALQIASALGATLSGDARSRVLAHSTSDVEAWQLYASARLQVERREVGSIRRAIPLFEAALRSDPRFALAAAGLSETYALLGVFGAESPVTAWEQARRAAKRALDLDVSLPAAHVALGHVLTQYDRDLDSGRAQYAQALQLQPDYAVAMSFMALNRLQAADLAAASQMIRGAQGREPASLVFIALAAWVQYFQREFDLAARDLARIVDALPAAPLPRQFLAHALLAKRQGAEVVRLLEGRNDLAPTAWSNLGRAYAQTGNLVAAQREIARVEGLGTRGMGVGFDLALMWVELGERERAFAALERGIDDHSSMQCYLNVEPALDPLRGEARFRALSHRLGLG